MLDPATKFHLITRNRARGYTYFLGFIVDGLFDFTKLNILANKYLTILLDNCIISIKYFDRTKNNGLNVISKEKTGLDGSF